MDYLFSRRNLKENYQIEGERKICDDNEKHLFLLEALLSSFLTLYYFFKL